VGVSARPPKRVLACLFLVNQSSVLGPRIIEVGPQVAAVSAAGIPRRFRELHAAAPSNADLYLHAAEGAGSMSLA
jgi:hypothetical protein